MPATSDPPKARPLVVDGAAFKPDPHAGFARLRPHHGVIDYGLGIPVITRHADVRALMNGPGTRQMETEHMTLRGITSGALHDFFAHTMLQSNPPDHARRRRPAARAFAHRVIDAWRPRIRDLVDTILDDLDPAAETDILARVAAPLPASLIAEILGAPPEDAPGFAASVYAMSRGIAAFPDAEFPDIERGAAELFAYVSALLDQRRAHPQDDFLTAYLALATEDGALSPVETVIQIVTLIIAGSDTTRFGLTATLALLLQHPDQWRALCDDPELARGAVEEGLRLEPPVGSLGRVVTAPLEVDGIAFRPGQALALSILSAQRDETVFAAPDTFDIRRTDHVRWSVSFGAGAHRCLGEALARAEMEEALKVMARRFPQMQLLRAPAFKGHMGIRGITPLHVRLQPV